MTSARMTIKSSLSILPVSYLIVVVVAVLMDLGMIGGGEAARRRSFRG